MGKIRDTIAARVVALRNEKDLSQHELARRSGLSFQMIQALEYKFRWPSERTLEKVAQALGVSAVALISDPSQSLAEAIQLLQKSVPAQEKPEPPEPKRPKRKRRSKN